MFFLVYCSEIFSVASTMVYACAVFMVIFCMTSLYRISYFVTSVLLFVAGSAAILRLSLRKSQQQNGVETESCSDNDEVLLRGEDQATKADDTNDLSSASDASDDVSDNGAAHHTEERWKYKLRKRSTKVD